MTYLWITNAIRNDQWKQQIINAMEDENDIELTWDDMFRLFFDNHQKAVLIRPYSDSSPFCRKIFPTRITYHGLSLIFNDKYEDLAEGDISRLPEEG